MAENTEGKRKFALWIRESSLEQVRKWYKADDCSSQSEFIEKAIHFYIGYISSENGSDYLPLPEKSFLRNSFSHTNSRRNTVTACGSRGGKVSRRSWRKSMRGSI